MATDPWRETGARPIGSIVQTPHGIGSSSSEPSSLPTLTDGERKPSKAVEACILELALRFPCPRDTDPDRYAARLNLLTRDCSGLNPALLRKACDRAAQTAKGLPYASEILAAAAQIVAERQAAQPRQDNAEPWGNRGFPTGTFTPGSAEHRQWIADVNRYQAAHNAPSRLILDDDAQQSRVVMLSDGWRCNGDGTVNPPTSRADG